jgi:hypothetical protein
MERAMGGENKETSAPAIAMRQADKKSTAKGLEKIQPLIDLLKPYLVPGASAITTRE